MQEEHRRAIITNFGSLVEQTDLDQMVSAFYEKGVFSEQMIEPYKDTNRTQRDRKRQMYRDLERRGPDAFAHLLDALTETGKWDLVRDLDPNSVLHPRTSFGSIASSSGSGYVSLSKKPITTENKNKEVELRKEDPPPNNVELDDEDKEIPCFHVVKSSKFIESTDVDFPLYPTRGKQRGLMYAFNCMKFRYNIDKDRKGAKVDHKNLLYLFKELGFNTFGYTDLTKAELIDTIRGLRAVDGIKKVECVFIVVSSHGYQSRDWYDTELRCSDGELVSILHIIEMFNNINFPELKGVPKVFIFQTCRGDNEELGLWGSTERDGTVASGGDTHITPPGGADPITDLTERPYSDILIAHSTTPGYVSRRDTKKGSWYVQALCEVFAERAHDSHVEKLFQLVDNKLAKYGPQTSSIDKWGFSKRLYLHPGIFEENASAS